MRKTHVSRVGPCACCRQPHWNALPVRCPSWTSGAARRTVSARHLLSSCAVPASTRV